MLWVSYFNGQKLYSYEGVKNYKWEPSLEGANEKDHKVVVFYGRCGDPNSRKDWEK